MTWHVRFHADSADRISRFASPEAAFVAACRLMDDGYAVSGIGTGPLDNTISPEMIARIYAIWTREKRPHGPLH